MYILVYTVFRHVHTDLSNYVHVVRIPDAYMSTPYLPHWLINLKSVILHFIELNCKPHCFTIQSLAPLNHVSDGITD